MRMRFSIIGFFALLASTVAAQQPPATLRGIVTTANEVPLARVRVSVMGAPPTERPVMTDERGEFAVRLTTESAGLRFAKAGYAAVTIGVGPDSAPLRVRLSLAGAISGSVRDQYGDPVREAPVIAHRKGALENSDTGPLTTTTNDLGEFRFGGLVGGAYVVYARAPGTPQSDAFVVTEQTVNVSLGAEIGGLDLRLETRPAVFRPLSGPTDPSSSATSSVRGRVATPAGTPIARAVVQAYRDGIPTGAVETDGRGRYTIDRLPAGEYTLQATKNGFITLRPGQGRSAVELLLSEQQMPERIVSMRAGQTREGVDLVLARGGVITGTIVDEFGEPMEDVPVSLLDLRVLGGRTRALRAANLNSESRFTDDRGRYRLFDLQPGTYVIQAVSQDLLASANGYVPTFYPGTPSIDGAAPIQVSAETTAAGIDLTLAPTRAYRIHGTLHDPDGSPTNSLVTLAVSERSGAIQVEPMPTRTNGDGTFTFSNVPSGDYVVQALTTGTVDGSSSVAVAQRFASQYVTVTNEDPLPVPLKLSHGATLIGRVMYEGIAAPTSTAVSLTAVSADFDRGPLMSVGSTGFSLLPDHTFEYRGVFGPTFLIGELRNPQWYVKSITMAGQDLSDRPFDFGSTETFRDIEVVVSAAGAVLTGNATDDRAAPVRDFTVALFPTDRDKWTIRSRWIKMARSTQDGAFRVTGLVPGNYYAVAVDRLEGNHVSGDLQTPAVLEALAARASRITLGEGQSQNLTLRLVRR